MALLLAVILCALVLVTSNGGASVRGISGGAVASTSSLSVTTAATR